MKTPRTRAYERMVDKANYAIRLYHTLPEEAKVLMSETDYVNQYLAEHPETYTCTNYQD